MGATSTLKNKEEIDRLFAKGRRVSNPALLVLAIRRSDGAAPGRVMFVAGKRLGNAVFRNRAKRVLREAARRAAAPWCGWDVALVARTPTTMTSPHKLDEQLLRALGSLGIKPDGAD